MYFLDIEDIKKMKKLIQDPFVPGFNILHYQLFPFSF